MDIIISMKNGCMLEFPKSTPSDFDYLLEEMASVRDSFVWKDRTWVRKSEIVSFELATDVDDEDEKQIFLVALRTKLGHEIVDVLPTYQEACEATQRLKNSLPESSEDIVYILTKRID
jgi:uncharacterized glyoxalase superfamily metalloenzyme YdcJ